MLRIGVDVGGSNTDCVVLRDAGGKPEVVASVKVATSSDVMSGIRAGKQSTFALCIHSRLHHSLFFVQASRRCWTSRRLQRATLPP